MFTGLVEAVGTVRALAPRGEGVRLSIDAAAIAEGLSPGDSVAVNGCCLTVTEPADADGSLKFDLLGETLRRTNLGDLAAGDAVNLERALAVGARMGGHFVQGHIDVACEVIALTPSGEDHRLEISLPAEFARYVVPKGSIAVDGISLTVAEVGPHSFTLWIIPHTYRVTNLQRRAAGQRVNTEVDLLAKYVERLLGAQPRA